jgi:hypothetical protein
MSATQLSSLLILIVAFLVLLASWKRLPDLGVALSLIVIALATWLRPGGLEQLGFLPVENWGSLLALSFIVGCGVSLGALTLLEPLTESLTGKPHDLTLIEPIRGNRGAALRLIILVWLLVAPIEEVLFRGFLMNEIAALLGTDTFALVINLLFTSTLFGLAHSYQGPSGVLSTGVVGIVLGIIYLWADLNIWAVIFTHALIDTCSLLIIYLNLDENLKHVFLKGKPVSGDVLDGDQPAPDSDE